MKIRHLFPIILAALIGLAAGGCKDDPVGASTTPGPIRNLRATGVDDSTVDLAWDAPADSSGISGYRAAWSLPGGVADSLDLPASPTSLRVGNLKVGSTYTFVLSAKRGALLSTPVTVKWRLVGPPKDFKATFTDITTARLTWTPSSDPVLTGYLVSWKSSTGDTDDVTVPSTTSDINVPKLNSSSSYIFWLRAVNGDAASSSLRATWTGATVMPPSDLRASSVSDTAIRLSWTRAVDTSISYIVTRSFDGSVDTIVAIIDDSAMTMGDLHGGTVYTFKVSAFRGVARSAPIALQWSTATRYEDERSGTASLRMYEQSSPYGSGLIIDTALGGPKRVKAKNPVDPTVVQLAIWIPAGTPTTFDIGSPFGLPGYQGEGEFDSTVYISKNSYMVPSLDHWYSSTPIDQQIDPAGNISSFTLPVNTPQGMGFYVRTGTVGNYHYARVFIQSSGGTLIQGDPPHRYIDIAISYQGTPNLPYARTSGALPGIGPSARVRR